jgi:cytochrome c-type biogenesis protein
MPMLVLAYSARFSSSRMKLITKHDAKIKKGAGIVLILFGLWIIYNNHLRLLF